LLHPLHFTSIGINFGCIDFAMSNLVCLSTDILTVKTMMSSKIRYYSRECDNE
jgi:hypothetical protein